jgi:hypothetical protein
MPEQSQSPESWPSEPDRPMPDQGPVIEDLGRDDDTWPRPGGDQVTLGLESKADDPDTPRPLSHPRALPGEEPATGDTAKPG